MEASTKKVLVWVGGLVLVTAAVGGVAYAATHAATSTTPTNPPAPPAPAPAPPPGTLPAPTLVTSWQNGQKYMFTAGVPSGVQSADALIAALQASGWTNVTILYFGPTGSLVSGSQIPFQTSATSYVATGFWNAPAQAVPAGVSAVVSA